MYKIFLLVVCCTLVSCDSRVTEFDMGSDKEQILAIFSLADSQSMEGLTTYLDHMSEDVVLMPHNHKAIEGKAAYKAHVEENWAAGTTVITHELIHFDAYNEVVIARGRAVGVFTPKGETKEYHFSTKNLFIFERNMRGKLKVSQVIFNMDPPNT